MAPERLAPLWPTVVTELAQILSMARAALDAESPSAMAALPTAAEPTDADAGRSAGLGLGVGLLSDALVAAAVSTADVVANVASAVVAPVVSLVNDQLGTPKPAMVLPATELAAACRFVDWALCIAPENVQL